jgi:hypothetical protein
MDKGMVKRWLDWRNNNRKSITFFPSVFFELILGEFIAAAAAAATFVGRIGGDGSSFRLFQRFHG